MLKCYSTMLQKPTLDKTLFLLIFVDNRMNVSGAHYHEMLLTQQLMPVMHESSSELSTSNTMLQYTDRATILLEWDAHSSLCGLSCPDLNPMSENWAIKVSEMTSVAQRTYGVATPGEIGLQELEENRKWSSKTDTLCQSVPHTRTSDRERSVTDGWQSSAVDNQRCRRSTAKSLSGLGVGLYRCSSSARVDWSFRSRKWRTKNMKEQKMQDRKLQIEMSGGNAGYENPGPENGGPTSGI